MFSSYVGTVYRTDILVVTYSSCECLQSANLKHVGMKSEVGRNFYQSIGHNKMSAQHLYLAK